jgi:hypothetical protein
VVVADLDLLPKPESPAASDWAIRVSFPVRLICGLRGTIKKNDLDPGASVIKLRHSPPLSFFVVAVAAMFD